MRPAILFIDPDDDRRRAVATALAAKGYEVIPAGSSQEGTRFAKGLEPSVIVGPIELPALGDGSILEQMSAGEENSISRTLVLLGRGKEPDHLHDAIRFLSIDSLDFAEIGRRVGLVLIGREIGLEPDVELRYLLGDLSLTSILDVSRALARCRLTGCLELAVGDARVAFKEGQVSHASFAKAAGPKAFCRLARLGSAAPFRITLGPSDWPDNIIDGLDQLSLFALEEANQDMPDPHGRIALTTREHKLPSGEWSTQEIQLASAIEAHATVGEVLDNLPVRDGLLTLALHKLIERGALTLKPPRTSVRVVTDSTCDLPPRLARGHGIQVVPLSVFFGNEELRDGIDITARDFYQMLKESEHHPRSEPPSEAVFFEHFHDLIEKQDILSIHLSGRMSQTAEYAQKAALRGIRSFDHLPAERTDCALEVVDSNNVSIGLGIQAVFAARMAMRGEKIFAIAQRLRAMEDRVHLLFAVDTLDYLVKGGRLGKTQALVGKLLGIKPILGVDKGEVISIDRARGGKRVQPRLVELIAERIDPKKPLVIGVGHAQAPVWADRLRKLLDKRFKLLELLTTDIGPVVGTHAGPGCVGAAAFQPTEEEWKLIAPLDDP